MRGTVYQIAQSRYGNRPHLYVVVVEFSGNKDCIVVPGFSAEGYMINDVIQARLDEGNRLDQIVVTLDNATHVQFTSGHTGKLAHWLVSDADRLPIVDMTSCPMLGLMDDEGLKRSRKDC